jgi:hypothetical protein
MIRQHVDVAVAGLGLAGSSAALAAARRGHAVAAFDAYEPGHRRGSSHGHSRIFRRAYADPLYVELSGRAGELWERLEADTGCTLVTRAGGVDHSIGGEPERAAGVDAGYPGNTDLVLEGGRPMLRRPKGVGRSKEAFVLEEAVHGRLPQRDLLDILTRTAYQPGWHHHFGPASGSDPKIKEKLGRYVLTVFTYGTLLGPAQVAAHMRGKVSAAELARAANQHATSEKITKASATVINAFNQLDIASVWGDGKTVAGLEQQPNGQSR